MLIGYARVSTHDQNLDLQKDALKSAGCEKIFVDEVSGAAIARSGLEQALKALREGDELVVTNKGVKPVPLFAKVEYDNGESKILSQGANIWTDGRKEFKIKIPEAENVKRISVNGNVADANFLDNLHPSLQELYQSVGSTSGLIGKYRTEAFPQIIRIVDRSSLLYFEIQDWGYSTVLYPNDKNNFSTLDETTTIQFFQGGEQTTRMEVRRPGWVYQARKQ